MKKLLLVIFLIVASAVFAQQDEGVIATGMGSSQDEAKKNAFAIAIEQTLGVMVSNDVLIENGNLIKDKIRSNSSGYIESYSIISSGKDGDTFVVTVKAKVSRKKVQVAVDEVSHLNDSRLSYEAVKCTAGYKNAVWCKGGDIGIGNMNFGIYADSYALLRQYFGDVTETQLYFRLTLRNKGYFFEATDQNGKKVDLKYVDMGSSSDRMSAGTVTEDFIIVLDNGTPDYLKKFKDSGLEIKVKGDGKDVSIKIPGAYIEGFTSFIDDNKGEIAAHRAKADK